MGYRGNFEREEEVEKEGGFPGAESKFIERVSRSDNEKMLCNLT